MNRTYYVYILASRKNGTLYVGVTNNLERRIFERKNKLVPGFTSAHGVNMLVYYEYTNGIHAALQREKSIKAWKRQWKMNLIEETNPYWNEIPVREMAAYNSPKPGSLPSQG